MAGDGNCVTSIPGNSDASPHFENLGQDGQQPEAPPELAAGGRDRRSPAFSSSAVTRLPSSDRVDRTPPPPKALSFPSLFFLSCQVFPPSLHLSSHPWAAAVLFDL